MICTKCIPREKTNTFAALVFAQNPEAQFWISLQRVTVSKASRQPAWRSIEHSLCASLSNRAHLSFPAQKKQQGKAEYFHNTAKSTGHILSLLHICSFLKIHHDPVETRIHYQSFCVYGAHRKGWTNSKYLWEKDLAGNYIQTELSTALHIKYHKSICIDTVKNYTPDRFRSL